MAYGQEESGTGEWRARYKRPDGTWGGKSGFPTEKAAEDWGLEQEALIRRNLWLDPRDGETRFGDFAEEWLSAVAPRLELNTIAKYRSFLDGAVGRDAGAGVAGRDAAVRAGARDVGVRVVSDGFLYRRPLG